MDTTVATPQTIVISERVFVVVVGAVSTAVEIVGSTAAAIAAAPEVAAALAAGVAVGAIVNALPTKELSQEDARTAAALELQPFHGDVGALRSSGQLISPFQNPAFVKSLPTEVDLQNAEVYNSVPHPSPNTAPTLQTPTFAIRAAPPTTATDATMTYPQYVAPLDALRLPDPGAPAGTPPHVTPNTGPVGIDSANSERYPITATTKEGAQVLARNIARCEPPFEARNTFGALKNAMDSYPEGWKAHHIVEQNQTPRFGSNAIQNTANIIALPDSVHDKITDLYRRAPQDEALAAEYQTFRQYVQSLPYAQQRDVGLRVLKDAVNRTPELSSDDRSRILADIKNLSRPELCAPTPQVEPPPLPSLDDLNNAVQDHNKQSNASLPNARDVVAWNGTTRSGTFIDLGDGSVAQHQGRGTYAVAEVRRDLGGQQPPIGQLVTIGRDGQIQVPQRTLGHELGIG